MPGLQPGAFAAQRHLTDEILGALLGGQDSNLQLGSYPGWLTATCLTIRLTSEQSIKKTSAVFSATQVKLTVLLPPVIGFPCGTGYPHLRNMDRGRVVPLSFKSSFSCQRSKWLFECATKTFRAVSLSLLRGRSSLSATPSNLFHLECSRSR